MGENCMTALLQTTGCLWMVPCAPLYALRK
jgi:hypothetical protein